VRLGGAGPGVRRKTRRPDRGASGGTMAALSVWRFLRGTPGQAPPRRTRLGSSTQAGTA